jgi:hypothetical protein
MNEVDTNPDYSEKMVEEYNDNKKAIADALDKIEKIQRNPEIYSIDYLKSTAGQYFLTGEYDTERLGGSRRRRKTNHKRSRRSKKPKRSNKGVYRPRRYFR